MEYYNELYHYGVKGMKWGVRRYYNPDGSLTERGKKRIDKKLKWQSSSTNENKVMRRMVNKAWNDPEVKKLAEINGKNAHKSHLAFKAWGDAERQGLSEKEINRRKKLAEAAQRDFIKSNEAVQNALANIAKSYVNKLASARLKDIRVEDTAAGRDYVMSDFRRKTPKEITEDFENYEDYYD